MIVSSLGAAYAPQTVISRTRIPLPLPRAPIAPVPKSPRLPTLPSSPADAYARQPAPVTPPITTPESADVMQPSKTYTMPNYGYATPQDPPLPTGSPTRWQPEAMVEYAPGYGPTATEPTAEIESGTAPEGSIDAQMQAEVAAATPWYKRPIVWGIGAAVLVGIAILRK